VSDRIRINRLAIYAFHGVHAEEKHLGQRFYISLSCVLDLAPAGRSDDWGQSVCYGKLAELVHAIATERRFHIIEALAEVIAEEILATFPLIQSITVTVEKPEAPVPFILEGVAVEIERRRHG
jgi:dihydroneopterin aldolase